MYVRQLMFAALAGAVVACAGCSCCRGTRSAYLPPYSTPAVPAGAIAVPAPPAPVGASYAPAAPCPTCAGR